MEKVFIYKSLSTANKLLIAFFINPGHFVKEILNLHMHYTHPALKCSQPWGRINVMVE